MQTYELMNMVTKKFKTKNFFFMCGTDLIPSMPDWSRYVSH